MKELNIVICGAGIAGISAAFHLAVKHRLEGILLVDEGIPLGLTSDKSTECYRNWWPGPGNAMVALMNRSIDLLEDLALASKNIFHLNRRGYLYVTADPQKIHEIEQAAHEPSRLGAGPLRIQRGLPDDPPYLPAQPEGYSSALSGADLMLDHGLIHTHFPYLTDQVVAALHVRRAGWFSAQQLGQYLLEQARAHGVQLLRARVTAVDVINDRVKTVRFEDGTRLHSNHFINAAGPHLKTVGRMLGLDLPVYCELHLKVGFKDYLGVLPRDAPLLIWMDSQFLPWSIEERKLLTGDADPTRLLAEFPPGVHTRPEGPADSPMILMLWEYREHEVEPVWPLPLDQDYPEIALRGLAAMLPGLRVYFDKSLRPVEDGGYYTKTHENRPLIGPLPIKGAWIIGALSGFGLMACMAAGELLAAHLTGSALPPYAAAFSLERYFNPVYQESLKMWGSSGQL